MHDGLIILRMKKEHRITFRDHDHPNLPYLHWNSQMSLFANFILFNTSLFQICQSYSRSQLSTFKFSSCILTSMILPWTWQPCSSLLARSQPSRLSRVTNPNPFEPRSFITISTFTTRPYLQSHHKKLYLQWIIHVSQPIPLSSFQLTEWTCWPSRFPWRRKGCWTRRCGCLWTPRAPSSSASRRLEPLDGHSKTAQWLCKKRRWSDMENVTKII